MTCVLFIERSRTRGQVLGRALGLGSSGLGLACFGLGYKSDSNHLTTFCLSSIHFTNPLPHASADRQTLIQDFFY